MIFSKQTSAHVTTVHKVDMTKVAKLRERHKADSRSATACRSPTCRSSRARPWKRLREFPIVNASIEGKNIIYHNEINIGIAVALENGPDRAGDPPRRREERRRPAARHRGSWRRAPAPAS
jgi:pyruvate dehydrogenase E2 component (dihydrolipoamide acetyltransferase)